MFVLSENIDKCGYKHERRGIKSVWFIKKRQKEKQMFSNMVFHTYLQFPF